MLSLILVNDETGNENTASYDATVRVNFEILKQFRIENFDRNLGYRALLKKAVDKI